MFPLIKSAISDLGHSKAKTSLTMLGIFIGVLAVVLLMSFGYGLKAYIANQFDTLGTDLVYIYPGQVLQDGQVNNSNGPIGGVKFNSRDITQLQRMPQTKYALPIATKRMRVSGGGNLESSDIFATSDAIFEIRSLEAIHGRVFTQADLTRKRRVAVLGPEIAEDLYGSASRAIGQTLRAGDYRFEVIGVIKSKGSTGLGGPSLDRYTYTPYTSVSGLMPTDEFYTLYLKPQPNTDLASYKAQVRRTLERQYDPEDFSVLDQAELLQALGTIFSAANSILIGIGSVSLLVGGIGIMNIMYATVMERIKEIGIRRAVGATQADILTLFLTESAILSLLGGIAGLLAAYGLVLIIQIWFPAAITLTTILIALTVSTAIGIIFGVFPARRAAALPPLEAIRYE